MLRLPTAFHPSTVAGPSAATALSPTTSRTGPTASHTAPSTKSKRRPKTDQKRKAITDAERKLLREHFHQQGRQIKHQDIIKWYADTHHRTFNQSTVSESLGPKYAHLDQGTNVPHPGRKRLREAWFPDLEDALYEWQQAQQELGNMVTGENLLEKAKELWARLPQYHNKEVPKWSNGWIQGFKARHRIRKARRVGRYAPSQTGANNQRDHERTEENAVEPRIRESEALQLLQRLRLYEEQQDTGDTDLLLRLYRYETVIRGRLIAAHSR